MSGELAAVAARWGLSARERIRHTIAAYTIAGDSLRHEELAAGSPRTAFSKWMGRETAQGRDAIAAMLARHAGAGAPDGPGESFFIRHFVADVLIEDLTPTSARGLAYFAVFTPAGPDHWGRYRDEFVSIADRWLLRRRFVRVDSSAPGSWYRRAFDPKSE